MRPSTHPDLILEAATDDAAFNVVAHHVGQLLGARSGVLHWQSLGEPLEEVSYSGHFSDEQMEVFANHFSDADLWASAISSPYAVDRVWNCDALVSSRTYEMSRIYNEWIRPMGDDTFHCLGGMFRIGSVTAKLGFHRARTQGPFGDEEIATLGRYLGQIRQVVVVREKLASAARREADLAATQNALGYGLLTLSLDGKVREQNRAAEAMLTCSDDLLVRGGRLIAGSSSEARKLAAAISAAASGETAHLGALRISKGRGGHYELSIVPTWSDGRRHIVVVIHDQDTADPSMQQRLRTMYQLTKAEADIALDLAAGRTVADLAQSRQTETGTVRNQIKAIAAKLGCSRQAEIAARVSEIPRLNLPV